MSKTVGDVMTRDVFTLEQEEKLSVADDVMRLGRIRHIPVVDERGTVVGIVSQRDLFFNALLRALGHGDGNRKLAMEGFRVKDAMQSRVVATTADMSLAGAAKVMLKRKIGCLLVLDGAELVGIVTEADFVALAAGEVARESSV